MKKRLLSVGMACVVGLTVVPTTTALAKENEEVPVSDVEISAAEETAVEAVAPVAVEPVAEVPTETETQPEDPTCICENGCTEEAKNADCLVCGAEAAELENCAHYVAPVAEELETEAQETEVQEQTAVEKVQAMLNALPTAAELKNADEATKNVAYEAAQDAYDALETLEPEELAQITGMEKLTDLMDWFNGQITMTAATVETGTWSSGITYTLDADGKLILSGTGRIEQNFSIDKSKIKSIVIQNGITEIGKYAFAQYSNLSSISIPNGVTSIGLQAFKYCESLNNITLPEGLLSIGETAFFNCTNLSSISIPNSVTSIGVNAFSFCINLSSISIPNGVTSIGDNTFYYCTNLSSISIPNGVTSIGNGAFAYCNSLSNVVYKGLPSEWAKVSVGSGNEKLTSCLKCVEYGTWSSGITYTLDADGKLILSGTGTIGETGSCDKSKVKSVVIQNGITGIGNYAFNNCSNLSSISIPNGVTFIDYGAFYQCESLSSITLPEGITSIANAAFMNCYNLSSITLPNSLNTVGNFAFLGCYRLGSTLYRGLPSEWANVSVGSDNRNLTNCLKYMVTFTAPANLTYDGNAKTATITKNDTTLGDITVNYYDQAGTKLAQPPVDVGTYTVKITVAGSTKYVDAEVGKFTIVQAENSFTNELAIAGWTWGDSANAPTATAKFGTPTFTYATEENGTYTETVPTAAGTYWVKATVAETANYTGLEAKKPFTIAPKIYAITYATGANGTGTITAGNKTHDVAFTLSADTFTRDGYEQTGWATTDGGAKAYELGGEYTGNEDLTLYPVWKDVTAPTGTIKLDTNDWKTRLNEISFGLFFKNTQQVEITAEDNSGEAVTIEYLLSTENLTTEALATQTFTAYVDKFNIDPNNEYIIYAKLTDTTGNVTYINSNGIVLDDIAPVITGIENGKTYCEAQTVTVSDKYNVTVTVNGVPVDLTDGKFTLSPAEGTQTVVVTDEAGNVSAEMIVTVNDGHRGGTATCSEKAVCEHCGLPYGELENSKHELEKVPAKPATEKETGNIEYWHCKDCEKNFSDENGKNEIALEDTVVEKLAAKTEATKSDSPRTGDSRHIALWIGAVVVTGGLAALITMLIKKRK